MSIPFEKSFASCEKAKFWSDRNQLKPTEVFKSSGKKYWFDCSSCNHSFDIALHHVSTGSWCNYCSNKKLCESNDCVICFNKSFASNEKTIYWSDKNKCQPRNVFKSSNKKYCFDCEKCNHSFDITLNDIASGYWCAYCGNKKLCDSSSCQLCFNKSFASIDNSKYWSSKNEVKPRDVFKSSHNKYWFNCSMCNHSFNMICSTVSMGAWCHYCSGHKICDSIDCQFCFNKSFASHEKSLFWSSKNECNPRDCFKSSNTKYWFDCSFCNHSFDITLDSVSRGGWCSYCAHLKLCDNDNCQFCFNNSFASNEKSIFWSSKNQVKQRNIFKSSKNKYWFDCLECKHMFEKSLGSISDGGWCCYCAHQAICDSIDCQFCFNNSFASNKKSIFWSSKNEVKPRDVFKSSGNKYWFDCNKCNNDFESALCHVSNGKWCPFCVNKTETKLYEIMKQLFPSLLTQFKEDWCKKIQYLPFDFCIPELKIIIELDGAQHFRQVSNWSSPEEQLDNDLYKEKCANDNGYSIIRLLQEDVVNDTNNWLIKLQNSIQSIIDDPDVIHNIYISSNNEYDNYL